MAAGNDPFPREEVTGLAAFENLQPVSSLGNMADDDLLDDSPEQPLQDSAMRTVGAHGRERRAVYDERQDPTQPLTLQAWSPSHADRPGRAQPAPEPENDARERAHSGDHVSAQPRAPSQLGHEPREAGADHLFDDSTYGNWEDDAATRVITSSADAARVSPNMQMDWDEEEPPTEMRPGAMFEESPIDDAQDEWAAHDEMLAHESARPTYNDTLVGVPASRQAHSSATMSGGRPSPFPTVPAHDVAFDDAYDPRLANPYDLGFEQQAVPERLFEALKSGDRRSWMLVGSVIAGLVALVLIVRALGGGASVGSAMVAITPSDAKLSVDGKDVPGASSPYVIGELAPGKHTVVATKSGFADYVGEFEVRQGESKTLPAIELAASVREVGFAIRSQPTGAVIWVDGRATAQTTPARLTGVVPGIHRLQLKLDGYQDFELQMFVPEATVLQLPAAELVALPAAAAAATARDKSARASRSGDDSDTDEPRKSRYSRSHASDDSDTDEPRKSRYSRSHASDDSDTDEPRKSRYSRSHASDDSDTDEPRKSRYASSRSGSSSYTSHNSYASEAAAEPAAPAVAAAVGGKTGTLRINSRPWSQVSVDGRMVGNTPQQGLQLTAGMHRIQLVNDQMGMTKTVSISIKAGEITTKVLNLAD